MDHSLGTKAVPNALREAGARVEVLEDHFPQDTTDEVWLQVAKRGWVILTKDVAIRKRPLELSAVKESKARVFALTSQHMSRTEMIEVFVKHLERMKNLARSRRPPFWATVTKTAVKVQRLP